MGMHRVIIYSIESARMSKHKGEENEREKKRKRKRIVIIIIKYRNHDRN